MDLHGVGPVVAARVLADVGDVARFADRNRFASWTGTAPLDASPREQSGHRLSRAGDRRVNHMIHIDAISQIRLDTEGRAYYAQASRGPSRRCGLKRRISDAIFRQLVADAEVSHSQGVEAGPGGHCGTSQESSAAGSHPHTGTSDQPLPGPAQTTLRPSATPRRPSSPAPRNGRLTTEGSRLDAAMLDVFPVTSRRRVVPCLTTHRRRVVPCLTTQLAGE
jgi:hypothetical protein